MTENQTPTFRTLDVVTIGKGKREWTIMGTPGQSCGKHRPLTSSYTLQYGHHRKTVHADDVNRLAMVRPFSH